MTLRISIFLLFCLCGMRVLAQQVMLDAYFNHETRLSKTGQLERFHYLWDEHANTGFSIWGKTFMSLGASLHTLDQAPTKENLKAAGVYIIVDPDNIKENSKPDFITSSDAALVTAWVKAGGVLVLMANDSANTDLPHLNLLADQFGLHFNNDLQNHVVSDAHFADGKAQIVNRKIFKNARQVFIKDACSIALCSKATAALKSPSGAVIAASVTYGKGVVFAVGDPWLYDEYVNGRLPSGFDNDIAATDLAQWLLAHTKPPKRQ